MDIKDAQKLQNRELEIRICSAVKVNWKYQNDLHSITAIPFQ